MFEPISPYFNIYFWQSFAWAQIHFCQIYSINSVHFRQKLQLFTKNCVTMSKHKLIRNFVKQNHSSILWNFINTNFLILNFSIIFSIVFFRKFVNVNFEIKIAKRKCQFNICISKLIFKKYIPFQLIFQLFFYLYHFPLLLVYN